MSRLLNASAINGGSRAISPLSPVLSHPAPGFLNPTNLPFSTARKSHRVLSVPSQVLSAGARVPSCCPSWPTKAGRGRAIWPVQCLTDSRNLARRVASKFPRGVFDSSRVREFTGCRRTCKGSSRRAGGVASKHFSKHVKKQEAGKQTGWQTDKQAGRHEGRQGGKRARGWQEDKPIARVAER